MRKFFVVLLCMVARSSFGGDFGCAVNQDGVYCVFGISHDGYYVDASYPYVREPSFVVFAPDFYSADIAFTNGSSFRSFTMDDGVTVVSPEPCVVNYHSGSTWQINMGTVAGSYTFYNPYTQQRGSLSSAGAEYLNGMYVWDYISHWMYNGLELASGGTSPPSNIDSSYTGIFWGYYYEGGSQVGPVGLDGSLDSAGSWYSGTYAGFTYNNGELVGVPSDYSGTKGGKTWQNGIEVHFCDAGKHWNGSACVDDNCSPGQHWDPQTMSCVHGDQDTCPTGYHWDSGAGACVSDSGGSDCPPGTHWDGHNCASDSGGSGSGNPSLNYTAEYNFTMDLLPASWATSVLNGISWYWGTSQEVDEATAHQGAAVSNIHRSVYGAPQEGDIGEDGEKSEQWWSRATRGEAWTSEGFAGFATNPIVAGISNLVNGVSTNIQAFYTNNIIAGTNSYSSKILQAAGNISNLFANLSSRIGTLTEGPLTIDTRVVGMFSDQTTVDFREMVWAAPCKAALTWILHIVALFACFSIVREGLAGVD